MIATTASGAIISDVMFDEVVITYPDAVTTVMTYILKGKTKAVVTETVDTSSSPKIIHLVRVDL